MITKDNDGKPMKYSNMASEFVGFNKLRSNNWSQGPGWYSEVRDACRNSYALVARLKSGVARSYQNN